MSRRSCHSRTTVLILYLCTFSFHHHPNAQAVVKEMKRVLSPGGRLILADPSIPAPMRQLFNLYAPHSKDGTVRFYSRREMTELANRAGLRVVKWMKLNWHSFMMVAERTGVGGTFGLLADNPNARWLTALHEAGHVVLQELFFPGENYQVDIIGIEGVASGKMTPPPNGWKIKASKADKEHDLLKALGGIAAESIETKEDWHNVEGASKDLESACLAYALLMFQRGKGGNAIRVKSCVADSRQELASYYDSTKAVLLGNWSKVEEVAESLLSKKQLTADEIRMILKDSR